MGVDTMSNPSEDASAQSAKEASKSELNLIIPPPEIRAILEKTASFVAKNGPKFEEKVRQSNEKNPKFSFLRLNDPYHPYYKHKIQNAQQGVEEKLMSTQTHPIQPPPGAHAVTGAGAASPNTLITLKPQVETALQEKKEEEGQDKNAVTTEVAPSISRRAAAQIRAQQQRPVPTEPPPPQIFTIDPYVDEYEATSKDGVVSSIESEGRAKKMAIRFLMMNSNGLELEVVKLTAMYVARNGKPFIANLNAREYRNPLFDFLKPTHPAHVLFKALVKVYSTIINSSGFPSENGENGSSEDMLTPYFSRDDVIETLSKQGNDPKTLLERVQYRAEWDKLQEAKKNGDEDEERTQMQLIDWNDFVVVETIDLDQKEELPPPVKTADVATEIQLREAALAQAMKDNENEDEMDMDVDGEVEEAAGQAGITADIPMDRVRKDYVPKYQQQYVDGGQQVRSSGLSMVLPSGQSVPVENASASMKVELLDPKYKEERARALEKNRLQNLASDWEIAQNLGRMNETKTEVFNRVDLQEALAAKQDASGAPIQPPQGQPVVPAPSLPGQMPYSYVAGTYGSVYYGNAVDGNTLLPPEKRARVENYAPGAGEVPGGMPNPVPGAPGPGVPGAPRVPGAPGMPVPSPGVPGVVIPPPPKIAVNNTSSTGGEDGLMEEEAFINSIGQEAVQVNVKVPVNKNSSEYILNGQTISLEVPLRVTVGALKATLAQVTKLPSNKQKIQVGNLGFLKDSHSLAFYNIGNNAEMILEVKERGGKKK